MKRIISLIFSCILLVSISIGQVADQTKVIELFCGSFSEGIDNKNLAEDSMILESFTIVTIDTGDIFYNGRSDIIMIAEENNSGERFMVAFKSDSTENLIPHSFEFTQIPCSDCSGAAGGFYDIKIKKHVIIIPIMVGSRMGSETILKYRFNRDSDLIELIGKDYEEYDRATGIISNKKSTNYLSGFEITDNIKSKIENNPLDTFTNCGIFEKPDEGSKLYVFSSSQNMYMEPSKESEEIVSISYGEPVTLLEVSDETSFGSITGNWVVAEYGHMSGFMFDEFLLPVPPPMQDRQGIEMYMRNIPEIELTHELTDDEGNIYEKAWLHEYGLTYIERFFKMSDDYTVMEQHLQAANISLFQGWLLACALINELDRSIPEIGDNEILDDGNYQIISVRKVENGVEIFFPERAD